MEGHNKKDVTEIYFVRTPVFSREPERTNQVDSVFKQTKCRLRVGCQVEEGVIVLVLTAIVCC